MCHCGRTDGENVVPLQAEDFRNVGPLGFLLHYILIALHHLLSPITSMGGNPYESAASEHRPEHLAAATEISNESKDTARSISDGSFIYEDAIEPESYGPEEGEPALQAIIPPLPTPPAASSPSLRRFGNSF